MRSNDGGPVGAVAPGRRVLIADDQPLVRRGLSLILSPDPSFEVVGEAENGEQAVTAARLLRPDVVVMDIRMPVLDGVGATRELARALPFCRVLALSTFDMDEYVVAALRAGANGFLPKDSRRRNWARRSAPSTPARLGRFRRLLEQSGVGYVLAVPKSQFSVGCPRIDRLFSQAPAEAWQRISCGDGAKGPCIYDWAAIRLPAVAEFGYQGEVQARQRWHWPAAV